MKKQIFTAVKIVSTCAISGAIGLEIWHIIALLTDRSLPNLLSVIMPISRFALIAHAIEGAIAAVYAPSKQKAILRSGIYTFFVGTVGLLELFAPVDNIEAIQNYK
jgi:hypothetical protein